jgi:chaperone protein PapD
MRTKSLSIILMLIIELLTLSGAHAAIGVDRTRLIINGDHKTASLTLTNYDKDNPYLIQVWIEDENGNKLTDQFIALPPVQRIDANGRNQIKIQAIPGTQLLKNDREKVYYLNIMEIPPKVTRENSVQLALQTKLKIFYRPKLLENISSSTLVPGIEAINLKVIDGAYYFNNTTPYYITLVGVKSTLKGEEIAGFNPVMIEPKRNLLLPLDKNILGINPVLIFINDHCQERKINFTCNKNACNTLI